ncbi:CTP synthase [Candidatus Acetothermia bacterium]|nr:CTP synthase [Candidatus Acetothermia bacterium]
MRKLVCVTGGVLSGLGKGVVAASIGLLLKSRGYRVTMQKIDPYLNVDAGTMNPREHGEVFITIDGKETDLDIGRYERFLNEDLTADNSITTGQVYWNVIRRERNGEFLGQTVQIIPHVTDEIKRLIRRPVEKDGAEISVIEVGGTVGDIEGLPFLEALRQLKEEIPREDIVFIHVTLLPLLTSSDELKTKPTQHSVKELRAIGIQPDIIVARCNRPIPRTAKAKIALFCSIPPTHVIEDRDLPTPYGAPLALMEEKLDLRILEKLALPIESVNLERWKALTERIMKPAQRVKIGLVGKYTENGDSYISITDAFIHAGAELNVGVDITFLSAEQMQHDGMDPLLHDLDGVLVPGGFGERGIEGKVKAITYLRENKIPYFGICLGMQCAVIEFARNVVGLDRANSTEFDPATPYPVIDLMEEQTQVMQKGGTMRLGEYEAVLRDDSKSFTYYRCRHIRERHRHRFEFNPAFREELTRAGMRVAATSPDGQLVEIIELVDHPWFVAVQFHPEFRSRLLAPHPLFVGFLNACLTKKSS